MRHREIFVVEAVPSAKNAALHAAVAKSFALWSHVLAKTIDPAFADTGAQVFPPARATVPPSLRESSSRVSSLLACYALGPPACAAPCSCRREAYSARSAWLPLGRACLSAWIEHRSGEQRSP